MHPVIYLNKTMVEATKARVAPVSSAMLYGRGVFTTLAIYNSQPFLWSKHWQRLAAHAKKLDIDHTGCTEKNVGEALHKLIAVNQVREGRARVILLARSGRDIWKTKTPGAKKTDLLIMTGEPQKLAPTGMSLAVSPFRTNTSSPLTGIKSLNYLEHVLAWEEAQSRDFDEAVVLNERGEIVSATTANLFWAKNGTLHTPTLSTGIDLIRTPVASKIAFPTAGASPTIGVSPAPADGKSFRSSNTISIFGTSLNRGNRYFENLPLRICPFLN
jgi:branched-subunit amino acid aminotransferase/4-amino-4-deoxychorismate lyase